MDITDNHMASEGIMAVLKRHGYTVGNNLEDDMSMTNDIQTKILLVWGVLTTKWLSWTVHSVYHSLLQYIANEVGTSAASF